MEVDARGLRCPLPYVKAKLALEGLPSEEELVVWATDPEAPVDLGALAADHSRALTVEQCGSEWRLVLEPRG